MLTKEGCLARRERLWEAVPERIEWLLIADPRHVQYLSNFWVQPLSFSGGERGLLLLERDDSATLLGDNFALRSAAGEPYVDREVVGDWYNHVHSVQNRDAALFSALKSVSGRLSGRPGAVEAEWLPVAAYESLGLEAAGVGNSNCATDLELGSILRQLRRQKHSDELDLLRQCMKAGNAGQARMREVVRPGVSEMDVYREVQSAALQAAGRPGLVYGDFRGLNAGKVKTGGLPTDYVLEKDDLFLLDYSVVLDGYRSDFTNTLAVTEPSDEQQTLFSHCQAAMQGGEGTLRAGASARDVYDAVSKPLEDAGHGRLPHHAGHGIGLAHPEPPILVPESEDTLLAGDVVTIEPGLYVEGIGGMRIEHNYLITDDGYEKLSSHLISLT